MPQHVVEVRGQHFGDGSSNVCSEKPVVSLGSKFHYQLSHLARPTFKKKNPFSSSVGYILSYKAPIDGHPVHNTSFIKSIECACQQHLGRCRGLRSTSTNMYAHKAVLTYIFCMYIGEAMLYVLIFLLITVSYSM